jgi:hypothetical protein
VVLDGDDRRRDARNRHLAERRVGGHVDDDLDGLPAEERDGEGALLAYAGMTTTPNPAEKTPAAARPVMSLRLFI